MKNTTAALIMVGALLAGCTAPAPTARSSPGASEAMPSATASCATEVPTAVPTHTPPSTPTATRSPEPTNTPTATLVPPTPVPTPTLDLSATGFPAQPIPYWGTPPAGFLAYDGANYYVYERVMHGRPVRLVIHRQAGIGSDFREEMAKWVFYAWAAAWEIFGGFPYESYTFKIPLDQSTFWGAQGIGHEVAVEEYVEQKRGGWTAYQEHEWRIDFAHEIFHAWNQRSLPAQDYFRAWFGEGCTEYYSYRITGNLDPAFGYDYGMRRMWSDYRRVAGTSDDMPLAEADIYEIDPRLRTPIIYMKGGLVCYVIDRRLAGQGLSVDDLMRALYHDFVTTGTRHTPQSMQATLASLTGQDWSQFFSDYVFGTKPLPLDGTFEYLEH